MQVSTLLISRFEQILAQIAEMNEPSSIPALVQFFDDDAAFDERMFSIIHTIEMFNDETYCRELLMATPHLWQHSPRWASIVFMRVMNADSTQKALMRQLPGTTDEEKASRSEMLRRINERSPAFLIKTTPVLGMLETS